MAWISGNVADDFSDDGRSFFRSKLPYQRVDGVVVANNFTELTSSQGIISPILIDQYGNGVQGSPDTWTGEPRDPSRFGDNCSNWTEGGFASGTTGDRRQAGPFWDVNGSTECFVPNHLYCFEQPE